MVEAFAEVTGEEEEEMAVVEEVDRDESRLRDAGRG